MLRHSSIQPKRAKRSSTSSTDTDNHKKKQKEEKGSLLDTTPKQRKPRNLLLWYSQQHRSVFLQKTSVVILLSVVLLLLLLAICMVVFFVATTGPRTRIRKTIPNHAVVPPAAPRLQRPLLPFKSVTFPENNKNNNNPVNSILMDPFQSIPPVPRPLHNHHPEDVLRDKCLQSIRQRQYQQLLVLPYYFRKQQQQQQYNNTNNHIIILWIDPAYHRNVGDHMLTLGEQQLLSTTTTTNTSTQQRIIIQQCGYIQANHFVIPCDEWIRNQTRHPNDTITTTTTNQNSIHATPNIILAVWHAGGNWGDLWPQVHEARTRSFRILPTIPNHHHHKNNHTTTSLVQVVLSLPQSLYFSNPQSQLRNAQLIEETIRQNKQNTQFVFTWREYESYELAQQLYPSATNLVVPDMAFQLGPYDPMVPDPGTSDLSCDILLLLRDDHESTLSTTYRHRSQIQELLVQQNMPDVTFRVVDWEDRLSLFPDSTDYYFTNTSIQLLSLGRVVICDRLHAAILAFLIGLPFIFIDPVSGKISKTLRVAMEGCADSEAMRYYRADNLTEAFQIAREKVLQDVDIRTNQRRRRRRHKRKFDPA